MEIINKAIYAIFFAIAVILTSFVIVFIVLSCKFKGLLHQHRSIRKSLTEEEIKLLHLSSLIHRAIALTNEYIAELIRRKQELQDRREDCIQRLANRDGET